MSFENHRPRPVPDEIIWNRLQAFSQVKEVEKNGVGSMRCSLCPQQGAGVAGCMCMAKV